MGIKLIVTTWLLSLEFNFHSDPVLTLVVESFINKLLSKKSLPNGGREWGRESEHIPAVPHRTVDNVSIAYLSMNGSDRWLSCHPCLSNISQYLFNNPNHFILEEEFSFLFGGVPMFSS